MIRKTVKWSLVTGSALIVLGAVVGPDRLHNLAATAHDHVTANVDQMIDTRVKLEREVDKLEHEYPRQIAELRTQLRAIDNALLEVSDEIAIGEQVVQLCAADLIELEPKVAAASLGRTSEAHARSLASRISQVQRTRAAYSARLQMGVEEQGVLKTDRQRVVNELASIEQEAAEFQSQVALLQREIESLSRNEKLVELAEKRRAAEENRLARRQSGALERLQLTISERREQLSERMHNLQEGETSLEYEMRARNLLRSGDAGSFSTEDADLAPAAPARGAGMF